MPSVFKYNGNEIIDSSGKLGASTMDANQACVKTALNASGDPPIFAVRAWVNFNGESTVAIGDDFNVTSITDNGTGDYTINISSAMSNANYVAHVTCSRDDTKNGMGNIHGSSAAPTASALRIISSIPTTTDGIDTTFSNVSTHGDLA